MKHFHFLIAALLLICSTSGAMAQDAYDKKDYKPTPYVFIGLQGGIQNTITNVNNWKLTSPTASVSVGAFFTPVVGARLHVNGAWNKGGFYVGENENRTMAKYNYNYITTNLDLMLNLVTMFGKKNYYPVNLYLIGGIGLNTAWNNDDANTMKAQYSSVLSNCWDGTKLSHNARVGAMLDVNLSKHWSVNIEASANSLSDKYNSKLSNKDDWSITVQAGIAYKFGFKKNVHTSPVVMAPVEEYAGDRSAETASAKVGVGKQERQKIVTTPTTVKEDIFFNIASIEIRASEIAKIEKIVRWLEEHPTATATITGHADAGTGSSTSNARYAKQRAESVAKAIKDAGIDSNRIKVDSKGDKEMPYGDNEKSRVAIILASEK